MLNTGDEVPHFRVTTLDGRHVSYTDLWQRKNLLLISIPDDQADSAASRLAEWSEAAASLRGPDNEWLVTTDTIEGVPRPGVVGADRWGEIHLVAEAATAADLPRGAELVEWLEYIQHQCPECQGEAK